MKILLASYGAAHVRMMIPLLPVLKQAGFTPIPLALTTAGTQYDKLGIPHKRITDFVDPEDPEIRRWARPLMARHHNPAAGISEAESTAYLGAAMRDLVEEFGEEEAWRHYQLQGMFAFEPMATAKQIIRQSGAEAVVATCSPRMESALLRAGVALGVPSFCIVSLFPTIGLDWLKRADNGHYLFVGNAHFRSQMIEAGRPAESICITGNPAFDLLVPLDKETRRARLREARGLKESDIVVLWAEQPEPGNPDWPRRIRREIAALKALDPRFAPMIRLHPSSQIGSTEAMPEGVLVSPTTEDTTDALLTCDILVTSTSTIGYEAVLMDKPTIAVRGSQYDPYADYSEREGVLVIPDYTRLAEAVHTLSEENDISTTLRAARRELPQPGCFAETNVALIRERLVAMTGYYGSTGTA